jgi:imidazolonepropionase-like amidohydrolase
MLCKMLLPGSFVAAAALFLSMAGAAAADTVVVTADRMIDVIAGRVVEHPQITITDGRISSVGTQDHAVPAGARRVDLPGMTLLPGLIDMHTHITSDPRYGGYRELEFTDNFWTVVGVASAKKTLEAGFTTIRNVGSANFDDVAIKQGIEQGIIPGPRIVPATYAIGATGGHCDADEFPPLGQRTESAGGEWAGRASGRGAQNAQVRRRGDQVLRHRRCFLQDGYRGRSTIQSHGNEGAGR